MDFRVEDEIFEHPKTVHLLELAGPEGFCWLIKLWAYTTKYKPTGDLHGLTVERLNAVLGFPFEDPENNVKGEIRVAMLVESGWLETTKDRFIVSGWADRQPWVLGSKDRIESARKAGRESAKKRRENKLYKSSERTGNGLSTGRSTDSQRIGNDPANGISTPSPTPSPSPKEEDAPPPETDDQKVKRLIDSFNAYVDENVEKLKAIWSTNYAHLGGVEHLKDCTREIREVICLNPSDPKWEDHHRNGTWGKLIRNWSNIKARERSRS